MKKILVVDDEFLIRYSLVNILRSESVSVTAAANGQEALKELDSVFFDVCCLDIHLPDMSGIEIMSRIKSSTPDTRIIVMTGGSLTDDMAAKVRENALLLLSKPFDLFKVKSFVERLLAADNAAAVQAAVLESGDVDCSLHENTRRHERNLLAGIVSCSILSEGRKQLAAVLNMSEEGMCLLSDMPLRKGTEISVLTDNIIDCIGTVRWCAKTEAGPSFRAGIQFHEPVPRPVLPLDC